VVAFRPVGLDDGVDLLPKTEAHAVDVEVVIRLGGGLCVRFAIEKLQYTNGCLDAVGRANRSQGCLADPGDARLGRQQWRTPARILSVS